MTFRVARFLEMGTVRGRPLQVGNKVLVPIARTFSVAVTRPGAPVIAGFGWTRPIAVEVVDATGTRRVPIPNPSSRILLGLAAASALLLLARAAVRTRRSSAS